MRNLTLLILIAISFSSLGSGSALAQQLLLEKPGETTVLVSPQGEVLIQESWEVTLLSGKNSFTWQKPEKIYPEAIHFTISGAQLESITYPENSNLAVLSINSEETKKATLQAFYPLADLKAEFIYQVVWEKAAPQPYLYLYLLLSGSPHLPSENLVLKVLGQSYPLHLEQGVPQRLLLKETPLKGEKIVRYLSGQDQAFNLWKLEIPQELRVKGRVESFEKEGERLTFLGEGYFEGKEASWELLLGSAENVVVKETLTLREKSNRFFSEAGQEVLYDTQEEKVYRVENRGEETKKIQIYQEVQPSSQVVSATYSPKTEEIGLLSITFELEAQKEAEIQLKIQGEKLTWGWAFLS